MNIKKIGAIVFVMALMASVVGIVGAQDDAQPGRPTIRGAARGLIEIIAEQTGLEPLDILQQARDGATLADIITANGGSVDAIIAAETAQLTQRLTDAVTAERITQEQMDTRLANATERLTTLLNAEFDGSRLPGDFGEGRRPGNPRNDGQPGGDRFPNIEPRVGMAIRGVTNAVAEVTGLEPSDIVQQTRDGATLADIITANGGTVEQLVDVALQPIADNMTERVASGEITQEQMDTRLAELTGRLTERINNAPQRPFRPFDNQNGV
jgi:urease gamma subunit